jgi:hypothetical protein
MIWTFHDFHTQMGLNGQTRTTGHLFKKKGNSGRQDREDFAGPNHSFMIAQLHFTHLRDITPAFTLSHLNGYFILLWIIKRLSKGSDRHVQGSKIYI